MQDEISVFDLGKNTVSGLEAVFVKRTDSGLVSQVYHEGGHAGALYTKGYAMTFGYEFLYLREEDTIIYDFVSFHFILFPDANIVILFYLCRI